MHPMQATFLQPPGGTEALAAANPQLAQTLEAMTQEEVGCMAAWAA